MLDSDGQLDARIFRFAIGVGLATLLAAWIDWPLAFITPILTAKFLFEKPLLTTSILYELLLAMIVTVVIGVALSLGFSQYPLALLTATAGLMILGYFLFLDPQWNLFATILLLATLMLPFMAVSNQPSAIFLALGLSLSGVIAVGIFTLLHIYMPEKGVEFNGYEASTLTDEFRWFSSIKAMIISFPVVAVFFIFQIAEALLAMIFIALLSLMISGEKSLKLSAFLLISNALGGAIAIASFSILSLLPNLFFYTVFIGTLALVIGNKMYLEPARAPVFSTAFNTVLVLIGTTLMSSGVIDDSMWTRLFLLGLVACYMVLAAFFLETRNWAFLQFDGAIIKHSIQQENS
jgi:hypothetical protein